MSTAPASPAPASDARTAAKGPGTALIVGAGLAGSLMAVYLRRAGWSVRVVERRPDPRVRGHVGGRSINLALSARGLAGLRGAGLEDVVLALDAVPMRGRMIHPPRAHDSVPARDAAPIGEPVFQSYSASGRDAINSVSRGGLNLRLIEAAASAGAQIDFDQLCVDVDLDAPAVTTQDAATGERRRHTADLLIGGDGAFSPVRLALQKTDRFEFSQHYLAHGYKELTIPPAAELPAGVCDPARFDGFALDPNALHIWPRGSAMMIALPNRDKSFTCTLFWPFERSGQTPGLDSLTTREQVMEHFGSHYGDAVPLMPRLADEYLSNPSGSLVTVRCWPWQRAGRVVLLGDAAHAIVPFYGQGMNAAFEDCLELDRCLREFADRATALDHFQRRRKAHADAIAEMALDNFVEMRDKVGTRSFRTKKRVEHVLHAWFPAWFVPQYELVSFSTVPYADARRRAVRSWRAVEVSAAVVVALLLAAVLTACAARGVCSAGASAAAWFACAAVGAMVLAPRWAARTP